MRFVSDDPVEILVYALIKDFVPIGKLYKLLDDLEKVKGKKIVFSNEVIGGVVKDVFNRSKPNEIN